MTPGSAFGEEGEGWIRIAANVESDKLARRDDSVRAHLPADQVTFASENRLMDVIRLKNMTFYGFHGVSAAEKETGRRYEVDCDLYLDLTLPAKTDKLSDTVNYAQVYRIVEKVLKRQALFAVGGNCRGYRRTSAATRPYQRSCGQSAKDDSADTGEPRSYRSRNPASEGVELLASIFPTAPISVTELPISRERWSNFRTMAT